MDLQIRQFENNMVEFINSENLPIEVKRLVLEELIIKLRNAADEAVNRELKESESKEEEDNDGEG